MKNLKDKIFEQFQPISIDEWKSNAQNSLRNENIEDLLTKQLTSKININSIYNRSQVENYFELIESNTERESKEISISDITNIHCESDLEVALLLNSLSKENIKDVRIELLIDSNFFLSIAKFRALRYLLQENFDGQFSIIAKSSDYNKSVADNDNNLIRLTIEAISAIIGGADRIELKSFNSLIANDDFGRRITNNILNILENESYMGTVKDPLSGSYLVENLTNNFIKSVSDYNNKVSEFSNKEELSEYISEISAEANNIELENLSNQKRKLIGVNIYQNQQDKVDDVPNQEYRLAIPYEELKKRLDKQNLRVYIANIREQNKNQKNLVMALNTFNVSFQISGVFELVEDAFNTIKLYDPDLVIINGSEDATRIIKNMLEEYKIANIEQFSSTSIIDNTKKVLEIVEGKE